MTGLFRPWAEVVAIDKKKVILDGNVTRLPEERVLQQDSTVSTTTSSVSSDPVQVLEKPEDFHSREIKYKSVKEHMKRRNEKYLQKKSKIDLERKKCETVGNGSRSLAGRFPVPDHPGNRDVPDFLPANSLILPDFCCSPEGLFNRFENVFPCKGSGDLGFKNGPELLDAALSHGLPPALVEEYARLLTEQQRQISEKNRKQRPKKFRCPHCQVGFSNNGQLKGHIRIHTGERPFKCDAESCGKSFTRNEELTRHRRIHSGLRPFPCPECGKRFGRKDHLKKHVKTHFQQRYQLVPILPSHYPYIYGF